MSSDELEEIRKKLERLEALHAIFRLWFRVTNKSFPSGCNDIEVAGFDLNTLDDDVSGCVTAFLERERLTEEQLGTVKYCDEVVTQVIGQLEGYASWYYRQLKATTAAIIEFDKRWAIAIDPPEGSS